MIQNSNNLKSSSSVPLNPSDYWRLDYEVVLTVLENYRDLCTGAKMVNNSAYENPETKRTCINYHGPQEEMGMLCAEVCRRVRLCGIDGMIVEERYGLNLMQKPKTVEQIAADRRIDVQIISRSIVRVTWFCVGRNLRKISYEEFKNHRKPRICDVQF